MGISSNDFKELVRNVSKGAEVLIGVDPGVNTGFAVMIDGKLVQVMSRLAVDAEHAVLNMRDRMAEAGKTFHVYVEDTRKLRLPKALQSKGRDRGAGSVGRDMGRWEEYLTYHQIPHTMCGLSPKEFREGDDAWFRKKTGWDKRTNEHGRCAAGLIWGK